MDPQRSEPELLTGEISLSAPMHPHVSVMMMHHRRRKGEKYRTGRQLSRVKALARKFLDECLERDVRKGTFSHVFASPCNLRKKDHIYICIKVKKQWR